MSHSLLAALVSDAPRNNEVPKKGHRGCEWPTLPARIVAADCERFDELLGNICLRYFAGGRRAAGGGFLLQKREENRICGLNRMPKHVSGYLWEVQNAAATFHGVIYYYKRYASSVYNSRGRTI